jgi:hypothetical protein
MNPEEPFMPVLKIRCVIISIIGTNAISTSAVMQNISSIPYKTFFIPDGILVSSAGERKELDWTALPSASRASLLI